MPNDQKPIKPNTARKQAPRKQDFNNAPLKKAGDGTMTFMLWSMAGTVIASCSSPIFSDVADLAGGGGGGDVQRGSQVIATDGRVRGADVYIDDGDGQFNSTDTSLGTTNDAGYVDLGSLQEGAVAFVDVNGAVDTATGETLSGIWRSLPYSGSGDLIVSPVTNLLALRLEATDATTVEEMGGEDAFYQETLDNIFGESIVTVSDILDPDNYNVEGNTATRLVSLAAIGLTEIGAPTNVADSAGTLTAVQGLFATYRTNIGDDDDTNDDVVLSGTHASEVNRIAADAESRPVVVDPNEGTPIRMTEGADFVLLDANSDAESLFGFEDPQGNDDADGDGAREPGQIVGIYIEAASMGGDINVMFRDDDGMVVGLADAPQAQRDTTDGEPGPRNVGGATFFYVSANRLDRLVLSPDDAEFNTNPDDPDTNPKIRFYVYDGEDATLADDANATILAALVGELEIEVTAVNDVPEITSQTTPAPITSNTGSASGTFQVSDADGDTVFAWSATGPTTYGTLEFADTDGTDRSGNGAWTFTLNQAAFDRIPNGDTETVTFNVTANDGKGGVSDPVSVVIMLQGQNVPTTGTNDVPVITEAASGVIFEVDITDTDTASTNTPTTVNQSSTNPVTSSAYGNFAATDDNNDPITWSQTGVGTINAGMTTTAFGSRTPSDFGALTVNTDGTWSFVPTAAINDLDTGQSVVIDYTIQASDGNGGTDSSILRVTLNGLTNVAPNRDPVITEAASGVILEVSITDTDTASDNTPGPVNEATIPTGGSAYGSFAATDADSDTITWSQTRVSINADMTADEFAARAASDFGALTVNTDGTWSFAPTDRINELDTSQAVVIDYTIQAEDGNGGADTSILRVTLNGLNNAASNNDPVITEAVSGVLLEVSITDTDNAPDNTPVAVNQDTVSTGGSAYGNFAATDTDTSDTIRWSQTGASINADMTDDEFDARMASEFGALTVDDAGTWSFAPTDAINDLDTGQAVVIDYTIQARDGNGGSDSSILRVTLNGLNNAAAPLAVASEGVRDSVVIYGVEFRQLENLPPPRTDDLENENRIYFRNQAENDPVLFSVSSAFYQIRTTDFSQANIARLWNTDTTSNSRFVATIIAEMPLIDTYTEWAAMESGGAETPVAGVPSARRFTGYTDDADLAVTEDTDLTASGWLQVTGGTGDITYGNDATNGVTVTGELGGASSAAHTDTREYTYTGMYGDLVIDGDGDWVYTLGGSSAQNDALAALTSTNGGTDTFSVEISRGAETVTVTPPITIAVTGANDNPVITEAVSGVILEVSITDTDTASDNMPPAVDQDSNNPVTNSEYGSFAATDADAGDTITWSTTGVGTINADMTTPAFGSSTPGAFGALTVNPEGTWSFAPTGEINNLNTGQSVVIDYTIQASDGNGGTDTSTLRVTLNGLTTIIPNNDPEITEATSGVIFNVVVDDPTDSSTDTPPAVDQSSTNPATSSAYGNFIATDADAGDTIAWSMTGASINASMTEDAFDGRTAADFGALTVNADGTWSFAPTDAINGLDTNQSVVIDYTIQASDGNSGTDTSILRVTLNGRTNLVPNNDPEITEATSGVIFNVVVDDPTDSSTDTPPAVDQSSTNPATSSAYGNFIATDADAGDTIAWSMTGASINASMTEDAFDGRTAADFGALTVNADGTWSFAPTDAINGLDTNQSVVIDYTIQASDGNGGIDTSILRVTLNGTTTVIPNNDPEITEATSGVIFNVVVDDPTDSSTDTPPAVDQSSNNPATSSAYGNFIATDADTGDTIAWSMTGASINASMTEDAFDGSTPSDFGALTVNADGTWSFAPTDAINGLDTNQSVVIDYTIQASDGNGGIDTSILRVTLEGLTNVAPAPAPIFSGVSEDTHTFTDPDPASNNDDPADVTRSILVTNPNQLMWSVAAPVVDGDTTQNAAHFGTLTFPNSPSFASFGTAFDGLASLTWNFDPNTGINDLNSGESVTLTYVVTATNRGGASTDTNLVITLNGAQDGRVTFDNPGITLAEDTDLSARLKVADIMVDDQGGTPELDTSTGDYDKFEVDGNVLYLNAGANINHDAPDGITSLNVRVQLQGEETVGNGFTITITDVNDEDPVFNAGNPAPPYFEFMRVGNHGDGVSIYTASATPDVAGDTITWSLKNDEDDEDNNDAGRGATDLFEITSEGKVIIPSGRILELDYETRPVYTAVIVAEVGGLMAEEKVTVLTVRNVADTAPIIYTRGNVNTSDDRLSPQSENEALQKPFYTVSAEFDTSVQWSLTGQDAGLFDITPIAPEDLNADQTATGRSYADITAKSTGPGPDDFITLDQEARLDSNGNPMNVLFTVVATSGSFTDTLTIEFEVIDENDEAPVITSGSGDALPAGTEIPDDEVVYTATGTRDTVNIVWSLTGADAGLFNINSGTGEVTFKTATTPDVAVKDSYSFTVVATSGILDAVEQPVTFAVLGPAASIDVVSAGNDGTDGFFVFKTESEVYNRIDVILALQNLPPRTTVPTTVFEGGNVVFVRIGGQLEFDSSSGNYNPVYHDSDEILQVINDAINGDRITQLSSAEAHPDQGADAFTVTQSRGIHVRPSNHFAIAEDTDISSGIQGGTVFYKVADIALLDINSNPGAFGDIEIDPTSQDADKFMLVHTALVERDGMGDVIRDNEGNLPQGPSDLALYLKPDADLNHEDGDGVLEVTVHIVGDDTISADISVVVTNVADEGPASFDVASNGNHKTAVLGDELTVSLETHDPDGASTLTTYDDIAYQWLRDGVEIAGETSDSYTVTSDDVDDELTVVVTYTDPEGNSEEVTTLGVAAPLAVEYFPVAHNVETNIEIFQFTTENQEQVLVNFALQVPPVPERNGLILSRPTVVVEDTETNVVTVQIGLDSNLPHTFAHIFDVINTEINEGNITLLSSAGLSLVAGLSPDDSASLLNSFFPESIGQQSYLRVTSPRTDTSDPVYTTMPPYVTEDFSGRESGQDAGVIPSFQVIVNSKGQSNFIPENTDTSARIKIADFVVADPTESRNIMLFTVPGHEDDFSSFEVVHESRVVPTAFEVRDDRIVITATETVYLRSIYLKEGTALDHETQDTLRIIARLGDDDVEVTVYVTNVNEGSASFNVTSNGIINAPIVGDVLTAALDPSSSDPEGAGGNITYSYQWQRDGVTIPNPTQTADANQDGASYTITEADEGHTLRAFTVYIDGGGHREFVLTNEVVVPVAMDDRATEITAESYPIEDESLFVEGEGTDTFFVFKTESFTPVTVNIHIDDVEDIFADNTVNSNKEVFTVPTTVAQINDNQVDIYVGGILFNPINPNSGARNIVHHDLNHILAVINSAIDEGRITLLTSAELRPYDYDPPAEPLVESMLYYFPGIGLDNQVTSLAEDADVSSRIKIADIAITSHQGPLELVGRDAGKFEIDGTVLYLRQNTDLDYDIPDNPDNPDNTLSVRVQVTPPAPAEPIGVDVAVTITNVDEGDAIFSVRASGSGSDINAPAVGDALSVQVTSPADPDGGIDGGFHYQWQRSDADGNNYVDIAAATGNSYVLTTDDEGTNLRVVVRYTDVGGTSEIVVKSVASFRASGDNLATAIALSDTTTTLAEDADVSSYRKVADIDITDVGGGLAGTLEVTGRNPEKFEIFGTALYLRPHAILDHESDIELEVSVQLRENTGISSNTLTIGITNVDEGDARFNITSNADINAPVVGNMLTVAPDSTNPDPDGNGNNTFIYQWQRVDDNGNVTDILGENNATYTVTSSDEDHTLRVGVKYTDGGNTDEDIRTSGVFVPSASTPALPIPIPEGRNLLGDYIPINHEDFTATPEEMRLDDTQKININSAGIAEDADTSARIKVADIVIRDDDGGLAGTLELTGADSDHFELDGNVLYLSSGIDLGMEAMNNDPLLEVRVQLNEDTSIGDDITIAILPDVV